MEVWDLMDQSHIEFSIFCFRVIYTTSPCGKENKGSPYRKRQKTKDTTAQYHYATYATLQKMLYKYILLPQRYFYSP